jgi:superfamily II DNA or RNA helicase
VINWKLISLNVAMQQHQIRAKERIKAHRKKWGDYGNGVMFDMPPGWGKTIVAMDVIIRDVKKHFNDENNLARGYLVICNTTDLRFLLSLSITHN